MDRETILKHSKSIRLKHEILPDFNDLIAEFCTIKGHPEHISAIMQLLQQSMIGKQIIYEVLEYFEKEYHIIKLERLPNAYRNKQKQLINIY